MKLSAETETETHTEIAEVYARPDTHYGVKRVKDIK